MPVAARNPITAWVLFPWNNPQRFAHVIIQSLSIQWPFLPPSSDYSIVLGTGCSGGRVATVSVVVCFFTTTICYPLCVSTTLGTFQSAHVRFSVYKSLLQVILRFSLG
jgi:hypothetical protein